MHGPMNIKSIYYMTEFM